MNRQKKKQRTANAGKASGGVTCNPGAWCFRSNSVQVDIFVGSRSLIIQLLNSNLIDEFQICIHPVLEGKGLPLFDQIKDRIVFKLVKTKSLNSGATVFYYEPTSEKTTNR